MTQNGYTRRSSILCPRPTWVYVISDGPACKIGITGNVKNRMDTLQIGNSQRLGCFGTWLLRSYDHAFFVEQLALWACRNHRGPGEWVFTNREFAVVSLVEYVIRNVYKIKLNDPSCSGSPYLKSMQQRILESGGNPVLSRRGYVV